MSAAEQLLSHAPWRPVRGKTERPVRGKTLCGARISKMQRTAASPSGLPSPSSRTVVRCATACGEVF